MKLKYLSILVWAFLNIITVSIFELLPDVRGVEPPALAFLILMSIFSAIILGLDVFIDRDDADKKPDCGMGYWSSDYGYICVLRIEETLCKDIKPCAFKGGKK